MGLKTPADYIESLNDGRVTYWDGEHIDDITKHPRFQVPIAMTAKDYEYDDPESANHAAIGPRMAARPTASTRFRGRKGSARPGRD